jgi:roadblock/LC7 domain-containing protein
MAVKKNISRDDQIDKHIVDEPVKYTDSRIRPDFTEYWEGHYVEINGERYIKQETADRIIIENHDLRETLYMQESSFEQAAYDRFIVNTKFSTSRLKEWIKNISQIRSYLTEKDIYNLLYSYMANVNDIDFTECPSTKSKINWLWENGWLPTMLMYINCVSNWFYHFDSLDKAAFNEFLLKLEKKLRTHKQHKPPATQPTAPF